MEFHDVAVSIRLIIIKIFPVLLDIERESRLCAVQLFPTNNKVPKYIKRNIAANETSSWQENILFYLCNFFQSYCFF